MAPSEKSRHFRNSKSRSLEQKEGEADARIDNLVAVDLQAIWTGVLSRRARRRRSKAGLKPDLENKRQVTMSSTCYYGLCSDSGGQYCRTCMCDTCAIHGYDPSSARGGHDRGLCRGWICFWRPEATKMSTGDLREFARHLVPGVTKETGRTKLLKDTSAALTQQTGHKTQGIRHKTHKHTRHWLRSWRIEVTGEGDRDLTGRETELD